MGAAPRPRRPPGAARARSLLALLLAAALAQLGPASAASYVVSSVADDPSNPTLAGTLRAALTASAANPGANTITFSASLGAAAAISLGDPLPPFSPGPGRQLTIDGTLPGGAAGARAVVSASNTSRLTAPLPDPASVVTLANIVFQGITFAASSAARLQVASVLFSGAGHDPGRALEVTTAAVVVATASALEDHRGSDSADWTTAAGGAVLLLGAGGATFDACTFSRNYAPPAARFGSSGGAVFASNWLGSVAFGSCTFTNNTAGDGGAVAAWNGTVGNFVVTGSTFESNQARSGSGGAVAVHNSRAVSVMGCTFAANSAAAESGALLADSCPGLVITGSTFSSNTAYRQAGVSVARCPGAAIANSSFSQNVASSQESSLDNSGGCLRLADTDGVTVSASTFTGCRARSGGGVSLVGASNAALSGLTFASNAADGQWGGGILVSASAGVSVRNATFTGSTADSGGGMFAESSQGVSLTDSMFSGGSVTYEGAGVYWRSTTDSEIARVAFDGGTAVTGGGGGYFYSNVNLTLADVTFTGGTATATGALGGGAVFESSGGTKLVRVSASQNTVRGYGGGIMLAFSPDSEIIDSTIQGCTAVADGGGLYMLGSHRTRVQRTAFIGNSASGIGGGAMVLGTANTSFIGASFVGNNTAANGAGIAFYYDCATAVISGCLFQGNRASNVGGALGLFSVKGLALALSNSTFKANVAAPADLTALAGVGAAMFFQLTGAGTVEDCTIEDNYANNFGVIDVEFSGPVIFRRVTSRGNIGRLGGAAGFTVIGANANVEFYDSLFEGNAGGVNGGNGGGAQVDIEPGTYAKLVRCLITGGKMYSNDWYNSGLTVAAGGVAEVHECTIDGNTGGGPKGSQVWVDYGSTLTMTSSTIVDNNGSSGAVSSLVAKPALVAQGGGGGDASSQRKGLQPLPAVKALLVPEPQGDLAGAPEAGQGAPAPGGGRRLLAHQLAARAAEAAPSAVSAEGAEAPPPASWAGELPPDMPASARALFLSSVTARASDLNLKTATTPGHLARRGSADAGRAGGGGGGRPQSSARRRWLQGGGSGSGGHVALDEITSVSAVTLSGAAVYIYQASASFYNTLIATPNSNAIELGGGTVPANVTVQASLLRGGWGAPGDGNTDTSGVPLRLGPLADNGGPTRTRLPLLGSPAINAGNNALLGAYDTTDQRGPGFPRIICDIVDVGAVEALIQAPAVYATNPLTYNTTRNLVLSVAAPGVVANYGPDQVFIGDSMAAVLVSGPSHGTLELRPSGAFNYTPSLNFQGMDSFVVRAVTACSGQSNLTSGPATFYVSVGPRNVPPVVANKNYTTLEDTPLAVPAASGLLAGSTDADNDPLAVVGYSQPAQGGTVVVHANGSFVYTPAPNFNGQDSFVFNVSDGFGGFASARAFVYVVPVNDPPVVRNQNYTTLENTPLVVPTPGVLAGSSDVENDTLTVTLVTGTGPNHGTLALASNGGFTYTPDNGFYGSDSFRFTASDGNGGNATAAAFITVVFVNRGPYAIVDGVHITTGSPATTLYAYRNTPLLIPALGLLPSGQPSPPGTALFGDPENDTMTLTLVSPPALGSATVDPATGVITFTPPYMKKKDPDGLSTSMLLQAADTSGLVSPLLNVTIVIGGKPPLDTPIINVLTVRLTSCSAGGVNIDAFSVTAGSLTLLDKKGQPTIKGVPTGMVVQVAPVGAPWPNDTSADGGKKPRCIMKAPGKVAAEASRNWDYGSCQRCLACLKEMGYDCKTGPYKIRLQAAATDGADWTDSAWSAPYVFQPTCEGKALSCYPKP